MRKINWGDYSPYFSMSEFSCKETDPKVVKGTVEFSMYSVFPTID